VVRYIMKQNNFESDAWASSGYVCGIDEVGRGSLFGPVVVGAVILPMWTEYSLLKDSKNMTERQREEAFKWIIKNTWSTVAFSSSEVVDRFNVYRATQRAMHATWIQIVEKFAFLTSQTRYLLVDAVPIIPGKSYSHDNLKSLHFPHGEDRSISIAAASILAKVTRDRFLKRIAKDFPQYSLETHKGYATKIHVDAVGRCGASVGHRKTFLKKLLVESPGNVSKWNQSTLFGGY
jgi:ribonuclease HII